MRRDLDVVTDEQAQGTGENPVGLVGWVGCERIRLVVEERGDVGESKATRRIREVVVADPAKLAAELDRMPAMHPRQCVRQAGRIVSAAGGKSVDASQREGARNADLRQRRNTVVDAEIGGLQIGQLRESDVYAVVSEAGLVDQSVGKNLGIVQSHDLATSLPAVAISINVVALRGWRLFPHIELQSVVGVQAVRIRQTNAEIRRALIDVDRRYR